MNMNVNFNNLRVQAAFALDKLTERLNGGFIFGEDGRVVKEAVKTYNQSGFCTGWRSGDILIDAREIQEHMDDLRMLILSICAVYEPDSEEFKDVTEVIEKSGEIAYFNPEI